MLGHVEGDPDEDIWPIVVQVGSVNEAYHVLSFGSTIKSIKRTSDLTEQLSLAWCSSGSQSILSGQWQGGPDRELWAVCYANRSAVFTS